MTLLNENVGRAHVWDRDRDSIAVKNGDTEDCEASIHRTAWSNLNLESSLLRLPLSLPWIIGIGGDIMGICPALGLWISLFPAVVVIVVVSLPT